MGRREQLSIEERESISGELSRGQSARQIGRFFGRHHSTISREISRNGGVVGYRAVEAQRRCEENRRQPKARKLVVSTRLHDTVNDGLRKRRSPTQVGERLRRDYPDDEGMQGSHQRIYGCLYLQARGELRTQLTIALRRGRTRRVNRSWATMVRGWIVDLVNISERPTEAENRAVPGFWEGDLILGKGNRSQIVTLIQRATRFVMFVRIPYERNAERVAYLLAQKMETLPEFMRKSITWDQGKKMARHAKFTVRTGIPSISAIRTRRGSAGRTRTPMDCCASTHPLGTDLSLHSQEELDKVAVQLNGRPRQTLGWAKPVEVFNDLLAKHASL